MKQFYLLLFILLFSFSAVSVKAQDSIGKKRIFSSQTMESFAADLFSIIVLKELSAYTQYQPNPDIMRMFKPDAYNEIEDNQIYTDEILPKEMLFMQDAAMIRKGILKQGLELIQMKLQGYKVYPDDVLGNTRILTLEIFGGDIYGQIPISYIVKDGYYYVLEILMTDYIFLKKRN